MDLSPGNAALLDVAPGVQANGVVPQDEFLARVGHMTRTLHDSLRGLGLDKLIERAAHDIPDARDRLDYVARMSEQAAQRVLNATDAAAPLQEKLDQGARALSQSWQQASDAAFSEQHYRQLAGQTMAYLAEAQSAASSTKGHLMDIMMAQDFQDLTGQVIKRVTSIAQNLEQQLVQLLLDFAPAEVRREVAESGLLNGPQINPDGNSEVVADQGQVDDLLDSLGF
ncbi:MAG: CheZ chemotaxis protein [Pseudomonadota bacterium]